MVGRAPCRIADIHALLHVHLYPTVELTSESIPHPGRGFPKLVEAKRREAMKGHLSAMEGFGHQRDLLLEIGLLLDVLTPALVRNEDDRVPAE